MHYAPEQPTDKSPQMQSAEFHHRRAAADGRQFGAVYVTRSRVASISKGRRWLSELMTEPAITVEVIAQREGCSLRKVNMTISLAFLAPDLVKAAIEGRLPYGMGVTRLCELPPEWSRQYRVLGLTSR